MCGLITAFVASFAMPLLYGLVNLAILAMLLAIAGAARWIVIDKARGLRRRSR